MGIPGAIGLLRYALEQSYNLYLYLTGLPLDLKEVASYRLPVEEEKFNKDETTIEFLQHIVDNPIVQIISSDQEYINARNTAFVQNHNVDDFIKKLLNILIDQKEELATLDWDSTADVKKAWRAFYGQNILQNELFTSILEETDTFRNDDIGIVFTFVTKAYNGISDEKPYSEQLRPAYSSEEDEDFGPILLEHAIVNGSTYREWISKYFKNWDKERVSEIDYIIMQLAVSEAIQFPAIDTRVILNEYLNLAHYYSSEISHTFINGILHELFNSLKEDGKILGN